MIDPIILFRQVAVLVLLMIPGVLLSKFNLIGEGFGKALSNVILYAAQPALIIMGFVAVDFNAEVVLRMIAVFVFALVAHLLFYGISLLTYRHAPEKRKNVLVFATIFTNAGYMGIPLLEALFGKTFPEIAIYGSVYVTAFNIYLWTLGAYLYTKDRKYISAKKMIINPATISTFIGLIIFALSAIPAARDAVVIPYLRNEGVINSVMVSLKSLVAPLSMLLIGFRLKDINIKAAFKEKYVYISIFVTLFLTPAVLFGIMKLLSLVNVYNDPLTLSVLLISASAPAATATCMFSEKFDGDSAYAGLIVSLTSVLCIFSMPIVSMLTLL